MEKANIGFKAGIIFEKLGETALAAGWLARENKIYIERRNGLLYIRKE